MAEFYYKEDVAKMLKALERDIFHELCKEIHELPPPTTSEMVSTIPCGIVRHVHCAATPSGKTLRHT